MVWLTEAFGLVLTCSIPRSWAMAPVEKKATASKAAKLMLK
jgi:hypothetical protein